MDQYKIDSLSVLPASFGPQDAFKIVSLCPSIQLALKSNTTLIFGESYLFSNGFVKAKQLVGSTLLVREEDKPELDEGEFYSRDLVGMRVVLKETNEFMGTVVNVYSSGVSDLLHVKLDSSVNTLPKTGKLRTTETRVSDQLIWVPFVEAIVPCVDMNRREMQITPPKGLLELNLRFDERSKKERRQLA
ncbi:ribosome maturation factor rimm [Fagus crenata]